VPASLRRSNALRGRAKRHKKEALALPGMRRT
jgi:hypothetical protein